MTFRHKITTLSRSKSSDNGGLGAATETRTAAPADAEAVARLINAAFRIAESFFIDGDRTNASEIRERLETGTFILTEREGELVGCVYVEVRGERGYFGLLSVEPGYQGNGLGRALVAAAEDYARRAGCRFMDLRTVNLRSELLPYYQKLGYVESGNEPFPPNVRPKLPCHFVKMSKALE